MKTNPINRFKTAAWAITEGACWYCAEALDIGCFELDHKIPRSKGGKDELGNLVPVCKSCNASKKDKSIEEFRTFKDTRLGLYFSPAQLSFWRRRGVELPIPLEEYKHKFYGETLGAQEYQKEKA